MAGEEYTSTTSALFRWRTPKEGRGRGPGEVVAKATDGARIVAAGSRGVLWPRESIDFVQPLSRKTWYPGATSPVG